MNNRMDQEILRQPGELIKRAELAHRWSVSQPEPFVARAALQRDPLDSSAEFLCSDAGFCGNEIAMLGSRVVRSLNTNFW